MSLEVIMLENIKKDKRRNTRNCYLYLTKNKLKI